MTRLPGLLLGCCVLLAEPAGVLAFQARPMPARSTPEARILAGTVEVVNGRTGIIEVRAPNGRLFMVEARGARFEAMTPSGPRAAEFVDVRPGTRIEVGRRAPAGTTRGSLVVRIVGLPTRATQDPFVAPETPAVQSLVRGQLAVGGTVRTIDRAHGVLQIRSGGDDMNIRVVATTRFDGFDIRNPDLSYLRTGDAVTILGYHEGNMVVADQVTLNGPMPTVTPDVPSDDRPRPPRRTTPGATRPPATSATRPSAQPSTQPSARPVTPPVVTPEPSPTTPPPSRPAAVRQPETPADPVLVFSGTVLRANADRSRIWIRTPQGDRTLRVPASLLDGVYGPTRKQVKTGTQLLISARRQNNDWLVTTIELQ